MKSAFGEPPIQRRVSAANALQLESLTATYGKKVALDAISFSTTAGGFTALLGRNGAGKSTLFALLTHLILPQSGTIRILGTDLVAAPRQALARMGIVFQEQTLDLELSVRANLTYFAALHGISGRAAAAAIDRALDRLEMLERADERVRELNGGHRRRTEIARALVHAPDLLLLDEPTVGLDAASRAAITAHVHALCAEDGLSVLWATHLVDEIRATDDVVVLQRGSVIATGTAREIAGDRSLADRFLEMTEERA